MVYNHRNNITLYFFLENTSFQKGSGVQGSKQEVTKVVSFVQNCSEDYQVYPVPFKVTKAGCQLIPIFSYISQNFPIFFKPSYISYIFYNLDIFFLYFSEKMLLVLIHRTLMFLYCLSVFFICCFHLFIFSLSSKVSLPCRCAAIRYGSFLWTLG